MRTAAELAIHSGAIRIERIDAWRVSIPMREPFRISSGEVSRKDAVLVRVADGPSFGWGESSAMAGAFYSSDTPDSCQQELVEQILPSLIGRHFENVGELESAVAGMTESRFVRAALETAAWELAARKRGISLRQLFGIADREIPSGLAIGLYDELDDLRQAFDRYRYLDYHRLKIKIKRGQDVELVANARQWIGDFPLFVDANADYTLDDVGVFEELDRHRLMMYEQPLAKHDLEGSADLQRRVTTPVCLDESIESAADAIRAAASGSCKIVNIKLQRVGGFLEAIRIIEACAAHGLGVWMGTMPELGIGSAQALILASHHEFCYPTDVEPSDRWYADDILKPELRLYQRNLHVPEGPGLGFQVDMTKVERYATAHWTF
jgi:O-succinylbenzoate synthase